MPRSKISVLVWSGGGQCREPIAEKPHEPHEPHEALFRLGKGAVEEGAGETTSLNTGNLEPFSSLPPGDALYPRTIGTMHFSAFWIMDNRGRASQHVRR
jgi:hypothetical protein